MRMLAAGNRMWPPRSPLRMVRCTLQAAARRRLRFCRLSKPAQAGLEPQAPAPRGPLRLRSGGASPAAPLVKKEPHVRAL